MVWPGLAAFVLGMAAWYSGVAVESEVAVVLHDGRILRGTIDDRTDDRTLWLRTTGSGVTVVGSTSWDRVAKVHRGGRQVESALAESPAAGPVGVVVLTGATETVPSAPLKVQSLVVEAALANWDGDVEADGLEVTISPWATDGSPVSAPGMLSVELIGQRVAGDRSDPAFAELGRWHRRVQEVDYGRWGATYRLPFQNINPQFDLQFGSEGVVHARLGVSGQGSFEASVSLQTRTDSPIRDRLQLHSQTRFFPSERTQFRSRPARDR